MSNISCTSSYVQFSSIHHFITIVIANLFSNGHPSDTELTAFINSNCFLIKSGLTEESLQQMFLRVLADGSTTLLHNALYHCHSSRFEMEFQAI